MLSFPACVGEENHGGTEARREGIYLGQRKGFVGWAVPTNALETPIPSRRDGRAINQSRPVSGRCVAALLTNGWAQMIRKIMRLMTLASAMLFLLLLVAVVVIRASAIQNGKASLEYRTTANRMATPVGLDYIAQPKWHTSIYSARSGTWLGTQSIQFSRFRKYQIGQRPSFAVGALSNPTPNRSFLFLEYIYDESNTYDHLFISIKFWPLVTLLSLLPLWCFVASPIIRWRRRYRGGCRTCGYDLRGNTSGVCPECGTQFFDESGTPVTR